MGQIGYQLRSHNQVWVQDMLISCYNCIVTMHSRVCTSQQDYTQPLNRLKHCVYMYISSRIHLCDKPYTIIDVEPLEQYLAS